VQYKKSALVTGGAGFIGSHLCDYLLERDFRVICMDNLVTGSLRNIEHIKSGDFSFVNHDITNEVRVRPRIDNIFHFASPASPVDYLQLPIETLKVGAIGTYNILELAKRKKAKMILASTSEVYGDPKVHPQTEEYWGNVNPIGPRSVYDEAKRFGEAITMAYHRKHNLDTHIVRIFNTYGPRMRKNDGRAIPAFICQALEGKDITIFGDGKQTRSFCFISDMVEGIFRLMESDYYLPVNIGNPAELTILELADKIRTLTGTKSRLVFQERPVDDPLVRNPNISKARKLLEWQPRVDLESGLKRTLSWFR
jgi:dTDP-glucose 4,6-dehydratase